MRLFFALVLLLPSPAFAEKVPLAAALERAASGNGELRAQKFQEAQAFADVRRVRGEFGPHIEALVGIGPITKASGNATVAVEDKDSFGRMIIGRMSLTQPIYTWGRKTNYQNAALAGVHVKTAETHLKEAEIRAQVKEAYYGFQLANSLLDFIQGGKAELEKARADRGKKKSPSAKEDYRLDIFLNEVEGREAEVRKYFELAKEGFALRIGAERGSAVPAEEWLLPAERNKREAQFYVSLARDHRGEFRQLGEGIFAKRSLAIAEQKAMYPFLAFMASYELNDTNVRTAQPGVFAYDPYNRETWAAGVGLKWDFQWDLQRAKAAKLRAESEELEAKEVFAKQGIEVEVRKAYLELEEAEARLRSSTEAYKTGKKWLTGEIIAFSSGLGEAKALVEAYSGRGETAKSYFEAVYRHHMAWAALSRATGTEVDPILVPSL